MLPELAAAFRTAMWAAVSRHENVFVVPEGQESGADLAKILLLQRFQPLEVDAGELGGRIGLSRQRGNYLMTLSAPKSSPALWSRCWTMAEELQDAFRMVALHGSGGSCAYTGDPYIMDSSESGAAADNTRNLLLVTVPWTAWTGGEE